LPVKVLLTLLNPLTINIVRPHPCWGAENKVGVKGNQWIAKLVDVAVHPIVMEAAVVKTTTIDPERTGGGKETTIDMIDTTTEVGDHHLEGITESPNIHVLGVRLAAEGVILRALRRRVQ
jgi:hypothetical protein